MSQSSATSTGSFRLPRASHARVADAMHPGVVTCSPDTPLRDVARTMATRHIHAVVVSTVPDYSTPATWSVLSSLDLVAGVLDRGEELSAGDVAASETICVSTDDSLDRAAQLMVEHSIGHLIVVGAQDGRPVGVLSTLDIAGVLAWGEG
jgi:CBS domain-containing protein